MGAPIRHSSRSSRWSRQPRFRLVAGLVAGSLTMTGLAVVTGVVPSPFKGGDSADGSGPGAVAARKTGPGRIADDDSSAFLRTPPGVRLPDELQGSLAAPARGWARLQGGVVSVGRLTSAAGTVDGAKVTVHQLAAGAASKLAGRGALMAATVTPEAGSGPDPVPGAGPTSGADPTVSGSPGPSTDPSPGSGVDSVQVQFDYSGIGHAFGANYGDRLQAFVIPDCFATTPDDDACKPTQLPSAKDEAAMTLTTIVPLDEGPVTVPDTSPTEPTQPGAEPSTSPGSTPETSASESSSGSHVPAALRVPGSRVVGAKSAAAGTVGAATVALASTPNGGTKGDWTATSLSPSGEWQVGVGSGSFSWSYPVPVAPPAAGPSPSVSLSYDSASVDGRTTSSNGQASWVGQGWDLGSGFIERQYKPCSEEPDASSKGMVTWGDLCWSTSDAYTISLNGHNTDLIPANRNGTIFRLKDDPGWRVEKLSGRKGNRDTGGDWFVVTTPDGVDYSFGNGSTPWPDSKETDSVSVVPVYGDDSGEPCHADTVAASVCQQAYRWNLDGVADRRGNTTAYVYEREENAYATRASTSKKIYDRASHVKRIEYGGNVNGETDEQKQPRNNVEFETVPRCIAQADYPFDDVAACPGLRDGSTAYPDVPTEFLCTVGDSSTCSVTTQRSPTFFTSLRLASITTHQLIGSRFQPVDKVKLKAAFPTSGLPSGEDPDLWLSAVQRVGQAGAAGDDELPSVLFDGALLQNRVDTPSGVSKQQKFRLTGIANELGGRLDVDYGHAGSGQTCSSSTVTGSPPYDPSTNTKECFPAFFQPDRQQAPTRAWFHKYVVNGVEVSSPPTGAVLGGDSSTVFESTAAYTSYEYSGGGAWHYDESPVRDADHKSWNVWRGYGSVTVHQRGVVGGSLKSWDRSATKYVLYRGMYGDRTASGGAKSTTVDTVEADPAKDYAWLTGRTAEVTTLGVPGDPDVATVEPLKRVWTGYWAYKTVDASETAGQTTRDAFMVQPKEVKTRTRARTYAGAVAYRKSYVRTNFLEPTNHLDITAGLANLDLS